jgi:hypothetical protein
MAEMPENTIVFESIPESDANTILDEEINKRNHEGAEDFKQAVQKAENNTGSGSSVLSVFEPLELDGIGYEVVLSGEAGFGAGGIGSAVGMSVLWIVDSDSPDYGGPYYYVFGTVSASIGVDLNFTFGQGAMGFIGWFEGADKSMTSCTWGGASHQLALQGALSVGGGLGVDVSYTSTNVPFSGLVSLFQDTDEIWRAVGGELRTLEGKGAELTFEYSFTMANQTTYEDAMNYLAGVDERLADRINREVNKELHDQGLITDEGFWDIRRIEQYFLRGG